MNCQEDIIKLADLKINAAHLLFNNELIDDAYYIGGYAVELLLKAKVCKTLGIDNFFDDTFIKKNQLKFPQTYKSHDLFQLLILSGAYSEHDKESERPEFKMQWSTVTTWNESTRYMIGKTKKEVEKFLTSVNEICKWIRKHL